MKETFHVHDVHVLPATENRRAHSVQSEPMERPQSASTYIHPDSMGHTERSVPLFDARRKPPRKIVQGNAPATKPAEWKPKKAIPLHKRPPWVGSTGGSSAAAGADIAPQPHGRVQRHHTNKSHKADQHFLQSLRVENDPNIEWRKKKVQAKMAMEGDRDEDDLPDVFVRLTDPGRYSGTHRHRFRHDGTGAGLEGRRTDTDHAVNHHGLAQILRDEDPEMDSPHKPILPWDEDKLRSDAWYTKDMDPNMRVEDVDDPVMTKGVLGRLAAEKPGHQGATEYDRMQQKRDEYKVDKHHTFAWQAGVEITF